MKTLAKLLSLVTFVAGLSFGQAALTSTTLTNAITATQRSFVVGSVTGVNAPGQPVANGAIDAPTGSNVTILYVEKEAMEVTQAPSGTIVYVRRGAQGTRAVAHASGLTVWVGPSRYFTRIDPTGSCTATNLTVLPSIAMLTGNVWTCPSTSPNNGVWTKQGTADTYTLTDATFFVPPTACQEAASTNAGTGDGTLVKDGSVPALKGALSVSGAGHLVFTCTIFVPSRLTSGKGFTIKDITYLYSVQTTTATSMVASTFKTFTAPTAAASETASSATLVDACNTCVQTPAVASANLTAVSAGQYYSEKVAVGSPVLVNTDLQGFVFTFELDQSAAAAMIVTSPGLYVHGTTVPL